MATKIEIRAVIAAVDKITAPVRRIAATVRDRLGGAFHATFGAVRKASAQMTAWAVGAAKYAAVGAIALAGAVAMATKSYIDNASALNDVSAEIGYGVEALQELRYAFGMVGVSAEEVDSALGTYSVNVGRARAGTGKLAMFLKKVSPELLVQVKAAKTNEAAFDLMFQAISQVADPAKRAALATAAFGGAGPKIARMAGEGAAGLRKLREEFRATGAGLSPEQVAAADELGDNLDRLKLSLTGVANAVMGRLIPMLDPLVRKAMAWLAVNRELIRTKIAELVTGLADAIKSVDWSGLLRDAMAFLRWGKDALQAVGGVTGALKILGAFMAINMVAKFALATASVWRFVASLLAAKAASAGAGVAGAVGAGAAGVGTAATTGAAGVGGAALAAPLAVAAGVVGLGAYVINRQQSQWDAQEAGYVAQHGPRQAFDPMLQQANATKGDAMGLLNAFRPGGESKGSVTVRFENAPPSMRVQEIRGDNDMNVNASVGRRALAMGIMR